MDPPTTGDTTMTLYHGSHRNTEGLVLHEGLCLTDSDRTAEHYATQHGAVYEVELDMAGLSVVTVPGYDHDANECPADDADYRARMASDGADVLRYEDEDEMGRTHDCWRLVSNRALAAVAA